MAKKKATRGRRRELISAGTIAIVAAAIAHATKGGMLKNKLTTAIRVGYFNKVTGMTGDNESAAVLGTVGYMLARRELNKANANPRIGGFRVF